jgi:hypothetical protein
MLSIYIKWKIKIPKTVSYYWKPKKTRLYFKLSDQWDIVCCPHDFNLNLLLIGVVFTQLLTYNMLSIYIKWKIKIPHIYRKEQRIIKCIIRKLQTLNAKRKFRDRIISRSIDSKTWEGVKSSSQIIFGWNLYMKLVNTVNTLHLLL